MRLRKAQRIWRLRRNTNLALIHSAVGLAATLDSLPSIEALAEKLALWDGDLERVAQWMQAKFHYLHRASVNLPSLAELT